jgi:Uma2 family endonuclease
VHEGFEGIPYFDEDLQLAASNEHRTAVFEIGTVLETLAAENGLLFASDHPIWYFHPETDEQRRFYGDIVIARAVDIKTLTADAVLFAIEVVSTSDRRKEVKDTVFQRAVNEYNEVPEFGLVFPDLDDSRSLVWYTLDESGRYREVSLSPGAEVAVAGMPGLVLRVKPSSKWEPGRKIDVVFRGEVRLPLRGERQRAEQERERAEQERQRAEQERERAEQERQRAEQERERAEQERERADRERHRADILAEKLRAMGIEPAELKGEGERG